MLKILLSIFFLATFPIYAQEEMPKAQREEVIPAFPFPEEEVRSDDGHFTMQLLNMALMLGLLIGLLIFTSWFLKKMMQNRLHQVNSQSAIKVLEQRAISNRTTIYALDIEGKTYILAETPNSITSLTHIKEAGD